MRRYGTGSLHRRASDGRWIGSLSDGRGGRRYVTGWDEDTVRRRLDALRRQRDRTTSPSRPRGGERVRDLLARWLEDVAAVRLRPRTLEGHREIVRNHLSPRLGRYRVAELEPADVQAMVTALRRDHAPQTVHNVVHVLSGALRHAMREGLVERNVASLVTLPARGREPLPSLTVEQLRAFLAATKEHPHWPIWALAATTGMRQGEVLSLRWQDHDAKAGTVTVAGTYRYVGIVDGKATWRWEEPKTPKSRRTLPLPALAIEALRVAKAHATSTKLVFARANGTPWEAGHVTKVFQRALLAQGMTSVRFHDLRHGAAHVLLERSGGDIRAVSAYLGHSTIGTTVDVYGGYADEARRRVISGMDEAMEGLS